MKKGLLAILVMLLGSPDAFATELPILPHWVYTVKDQTIEPDHIVATNGRGLHENTQLYNLRTDRSEEKNLAMQYAEKVKELFAAMRHSIERGKSRP